MSFYEYNEEIKSMIYDLKGCGDIELAPLFLYEQAEYLRNRFRGYTIIPIPSYREKDKTRGFNHVKEIFKCINSNYLDTIEKIDDYKQSDHNAEERREIGSHLRWIGGNLENKKVLLVDDIITTGSTMEACADLCMRNGAKKVFLLSLVKVEEHSKKKKTPKILGFLRKKE